jgi:hypothetical protein
MSKRSKKIGSNFEVRSKSHKNGYNKRCPIHSV